VSSDVGVWSSFASAAHPFLLIWTFIIVSFLNPNQYRYVIVLTCPAIIIIIIRKFEFFQRSKPLYSWCQRTVLLFTIIIHFKTFKCSIISTWVHWPSNRG
jgi:hypothetical protein